MVKENFEAYANLKIEIAKLEKKLEELNPIILAQMPEDTPVELEDIGVFSIGKRKKWEFSTAVETIREELKDKEKLEQQTGVASYTSKPYLMFKANA